MCSRVHHLNIRCLKFRGQARLRTAVTKCQSRASEKGFSKSTTASLATFLGQGGTQTERQHKVPEVPATLVHDVRCCRPGCWHFCVVVANRADRCRFAATQNQRSRNVETKPISPSSPETSQKEIDILLCRGPTGSMAMVSPRLHRDMERRVRAAYSVDLDRHRCSSVPTGSIRYHCRDETDRGATAPAAGYRGYRASALGPRLMSRTKHIRTARSEPPPSSTKRYVVGAEDRDRPGASNRCSVGQAKQADRTGQKGDTRRQRALPPPTISSTAGAAGLSLGGTVEALLSSEEGFCSPGGNSTRPSSMPTADDAGKTDWSRGRTQTMTSELDSPKKLMQVMEERDRAIHVCLQV